MQAGDVKSPSPVLSPTTTLFENSPGTPIRHRPTFARFASVLDGHTQRYDAVKGEDSIEITEIPRSQEEDPQVGLGISYGADTSYPRAPPGSAVPNTVDTAYDPGLPSPYWSASHKGKRSVNSFQSSLHQSFTPQTDTQPLRKRQSFADTVRLNYEDFSPSRACPSREQMLHGRRDCTNIIILTLSIYSTIFSGIYLVIAARAPRYGTWIGSNASHRSLSSANANLLTAFFAKTIELSFATVFVAFLGQVLWRRALAKSRSRGVTLAEMDMRSWVMQPGTMLTRFGAMRSTLLSVLGLLTFAAALVSMLYTTASEALVQPQLKFGPWEPKLMQGLVKFSWANTKYIEKLCASPYKDSDAVFGGTTCAQIEYAAQGYHNYQRFLADWTARVDNGSGTSDQTMRPNGFALMTENTTVSAPWIDIKDIPAISMAHNRIIHNISMAMPHAGVTSASRDGKNGILQPEDLDGLGVYSLHASVPSPAINVMCVSMNQTELKPMITKNNTGVKTVVDDLFGWNLAGSNIAPPIFDKMPIDFNTIMNNRTGTIIKYGVKAIYLLGKGGPEQGYMLCSMSAFQTPDCSTRYHVSRSGAELEAICGSEDNHLRYLNSLPNATNPSISLDWPAGAGEWANSLSLNAGTADGNASNARLLTQFIPTTEMTPATARLDPKFPSPAEALAVMAGCTLLMGTIDTPFVEFWNYSTTIMEKGQWQNFNASLRAQQYASGGNRGYQHGFHVVLVLVFVLNLICLMFLLLNKSMITDFSDPVNLFSLAVNSPPSDAMAGSCGGGPRGDQFKVPWYVNSVGDHLYIDSVSEQRGKHHEEEGAHGSVAVVDGSLSPVKHAFRRLSSKAGLL